MDCRNIVLSCHPDNLSHFCTLFYWPTEQYNNTLSMLNTTSMIAYGTPRVGRPSFQYIVLCITHFPPTFLSSHFLSFSLSMNNIFWLANVAMCTLFAVSYKSFAQAWTIKLIELAFQGVFLTSKTSYVNITQVIWIKGRRDYRSRRNRDHAVSKILLTTRLFVTVIL